MSMASGIFSAKNGSLPFLLVVSRSRSGRTAVNWKPSGHSVSANARDLNGRFVGKKLMRNVRQHGSGLKTLERKCNNTAHGIEMQFVWFSSSAGKNGPWSNV